ncbi:hypothetical protein ABIB90_002753 [Bradyrhizobium sp. JR4.1]
MSLWLTRADDAAVFCYRILMRFEQKYCGGAPLGPVEGYPEGTQESRNGAWRAAWALPLIARVHARLRLPSTARGTMRRGLHRERRALGCRLGIGARQRSARAMSCKPVRGVGVRAARAATTWRCQRQARHVAPARWGGIGIVWVSRPYRLVVNTAGPLPVAASESPAADAELVARWLPSATRPELRHCLGPSRLTAFRHRCP